VRVRRRTVRRGKLLGVRRRSFLVAFGALGAIATTGACVPPSRAPVPGASGVPFPLYPMSLVFVGPREAGEPVGALLPDGSIVHKREGVVGHLLPDRVVAPDGHPVVVAAPNGDVFLDPKMPPMRFDARDALVSARGEAVYVDDAGVPSWNEGGPRGSLPAMPVRFTPFTPAARRTAEVLFMILMEAAWRRGLT
jgi:hypothetical protein